MQTEPSYRGRFAPSPTGPLHFGSLVAALGSWLFARQARGQWLVRIEDLDPPREVPGAAERQLETLAAFGLVPDQAPWFQSTRGGAYALALDALLASGDAFECHCSRGDLEASGGVHRRCVGRPRPGRLPAIRLRLPDGERAFHDRIQGDVRQDLGREVGDVVLRRADGFWAYQLAVVVDDADQGISDVVRGADLLDSTPRQVYLQQRLGLPTPAYAHLPLVRDADGRKLGKSLAALPVDGQDPLPALHAAWRFLGQDPAQLPARGTPKQVLAAAVAGFDATRIPRQNHWSPVQEK
ncbi:glutamyl-Q tRNA(Asp) synthetase [Arenimonas soli]|uniref:Glutamyl-Q tRNA(Asp) synthetase n=1 Tax=Arenimonas soli TaxID=2269504 RepID=A0ABQ1HDW1_9GAMM|nr:tRNA glutamyl-Q(34) synthetase GluQRS [Arenimonas soli]GGA72916.1 glutamyl-Q tRNA(Asp) synthetase [Arenimonas soli]